MPWERGWSLRLLLKLTISYTPNYRGAEQCNHPSFQRFTVNANILMYYNIVIKYNIHVAMVLQKHWNFGGYI